EPRTVAALAANAATSPRRSAELRWVRMDLPPSRWWADTRTTDPMPSRFRAQATPGDLCRKISCRAPSRAPWAPPSEAYPQLDQAPRSTTPSPADRGGEPASLHLRLSSPGHSLGRLGRPGRGAGP